MRVNTLKITLDQVISEFEESGFDFIKSVFPTEKHLEVNAMFLDEVENIINVPPQFFGAMKSHPIVLDGKLIFQDRASMIVPNIVKKFRKIGGVIDARAGCGVRARYLASLIDAPIILFESRPARLESLKARNRNNHSNISIVDGSFLGCALNDPLYSKATVVIVEPPSSGTSIVDKLGYLLQEEEFPSQSFTRRDLLTFKKQQVQYLKQAFQCIVLLT